MSCPLLSICIPTYERPELLDKTLHSIVSQNTCYSDYEICISDDSVSDETEKIVKKYTQYNIIYKHIPPLSGYMNLLYALKMGRGQYLKLINDYSSMLDNTINLMLEIIKKEIDKKSVIFWSDGLCVDYRGNSLDSYLTYIGVYSTWAICFGIWRNDFERINSSCVFDEMFPHVSVFFENCKKNQNYIICGEKLFLNQDLSRKGGYNIPEVFGIRYTNLLSQLKNNFSIKEKTFNYLTKKNILFIARCKASSAINPDKYFFSFKDDQNIIKNTFGITSVALYNCFYLLIYLKNLIKKFLRNLKHS